MTNILILDCVYTKIVTDGNFKKLMFKQLSFSHLRLITIGASYITAYESVGKTNCNTAE